MRVHQGERPGRSVGSVDIVGRRRRGPISQGESTARAGPRGAGECHALYRTPHSRSHPYGPSLTPLARSPSSEAGGAACGEGRACGEGTLDSKLHPIEGGGGHWRRGGRLLGPGARRQLLIALVLLQLGRPQQPNIEQRATVVQLCQAWALVGQTQRRRAV